MSPLHLPCPSTWQYVWGIGGNVISIGGNGIIQSTFLALISPHVYLLLMGPLHWPSPWAAVLQDKPAPFWNSSKKNQRTCTSSSVGSSTSCSLYICFSLVLYRLERNLCSALVSSTGCGETPALMPGALPPHSPILVLTGLFLACFSPCPSYGCGVFCLVLIKFFSPNMPPTWPMGPATSCSGSAENLCVQHRAAPPWS